MKNISIKDSTLWAKGKEGIKTSVQALSFIHSNDIVSTSREAHPQNLFFFTGLVEASMKKGLVYSIKLVIKDTGEIQNSHCECPGGCGPNSSCKHVLTSLLCLSDFFAGEPLRVSKSCADVLQTFNRPRTSHQGSISFE